MFVVRFCSIKMIISCNKIFVDTFRIESQIEKNTIIEFKDSTVKYKVWYFVDIFIELRIVSTYLNLVRIYFENGISTILALSQRCIQFKLRIKIQSVN